LSEKLFYNDENSANEYDNETFHIVKIEIEHNPEIILVFGKFLKLFKIIWFQRQPLYRKAILAGLISKDCIIRKLKVITYFNYKYVMIYIFNFL